MLQRLRRLKYGDAEAEFGEVLEEVEEEIEELPVPKSTPHEGEFGQRYLKELDRFSNNSAIFIAWLEVEFAILNLAIAALLVRARQAGVTIAYGTRAPTMSKWLPEVLPAPGDIKIESQAQDRFYKTDLDNALKAKGITTLVLAGWKVSGSVTYTSVGATLRGYTVVVPVDASLDATDYEIAIGQYQILHQHSSNAANEPLKAGASTLSRTDMIAFK